MPAINSVFIKVYNQKPVYRPGDELKGEWTVDIGEPISVKNVSVSFRGATLTRWANTESKADDNIGFEDITTQEKIVFPTSNRTGETVEYPAGKYVYKFSFKVPTGMLPSTYEGKYGAIRYWLAFDIERPVLRSHVRRLKVITVLDEIDVNIPEYSKYVGRKTEKVVTKALGFGNQGVVTLFAQTDRGAYCSGEKIYIKYIAENKSDKDLGMVRMELMQKVKFRASGEEKYKYLCLTKTFGGEMKKGVKLTSLNEKLFLRVPAVPPSTRHRSSHVINVQYYVKVIIDIPKLNGGDSMVILPITIGTIPQGHKAVPEENASGASNIQVIDARSAITYCQCVDGYEDGPTVWSTDFSFPRFAYVPFCTYVPDFKRPVVKKTVGNKAVTKPSNPVKGNTPGDNKLQNKSVSPAVENVPRLQPSAPPCGLHPPSYEDVLREMEGYPEQMPDENTGSQEQLAGTNESESEDSQENIPGNFDHQAIMIIRFSDVCLKEFRTNLKQNRDMLVENGGELIALAPQVVVTKGTWPAHTSIAVLMFKTYESGTEWFKGFKKCCDASGVDILDCDMIKASDEDFQNEKNVFSMSIVRIQGDFKSEEFKNVAKKVKDVIKPARFEIGGRLISTGKVMKNLTEKTISESSFVSILQWDSVQQNSDYRVALLGKFKDIIDSLRKFYVTEILVLFQTENTCYMQHETGDSRY